ncbi:unnamed protein product, partial [Darwinula stevensoni]
QILVIKLKEIKEEPFATLINLLFGDIIDVLESTEEGKPILRKTIAELLFQGYNLTFIESLRTFFLENLLMPEHLFDSLLSDNLPPEMSDNKFGFYRLNDSSDGIYLVGTGENGLEDFADIKLWQGKPFHYKEPWRTDECNMINGTDGTIFPPSVDENSVLYVFTPDLCRSVYLTYEQDVEFQGTPGLRFIVDPDVLEDPEINLANKATQLPDIPLVMSMPHFYLGSEAYFNESVVEGLEPRKEWHQTFVDLEPVRIHLSSTILIRSRSVYLTYEQDVELQGTPGLRFIVDPDVLEDPEINLANKCFCLSNGTCLKAGVLDLSECRDIPLVMSMPHFYLGSEEYFNESVVEGLEPRKEWHQTFVDLEPLTGTILNASKKLQVNFRLRPIEKYPSFANVSEMLFPIFWMNESVTLTQELSDDLYDRIVMPQEAITIGSEAAFGIGLFGILVVVGVCALQGLRN